MDRRLSPVVPSPVKAGQKVKDRGVDEGKSDVVETAFQKEIRAAPECTSRSAARL